MGPRHGAKDVFLRKWDLSQSMRGQPGTEQGRAPQAWGVSREQARGMSQGRLGALTGLPWVWSCKGELAEDFL